MTNASGMSNKKSVLLFEKLCVWGTVAVAGLLGRGRGRRSPGVLDVFPAAPALFIPNTTAESSERGEGRFT